MTKKKKEKDYDVIWIFDPPDNSIGCIRATLFAIMVIGGVFLFIYILTLIN